VDVCSGRVSRLALLVLSLLIAPPLQAAPEIEDISAYSEKLMVITDGAGHYAAFVPYIGTGQSASSTHSSDGIRDQFVFYGDQKKLHRQTVMSASYQGSEKYDFWMHDPWMSQEGQPEIKFVDGIFQISCGEKVVVAEPVTEQQRTQVLEKGTFLGSAFEREPVGLFRDDYGVYYYIDRLEKEVLDDYRIFSGWQGDLKRTNMVAVARDSAGMVFSTRTGDLRLVIRGEDSLWYQKDEKRILLRLPIAVNQDLIYNGLDVYTDELHGTPCDDL
jgi:hypothetical protein